MRGNIQKSEAYAIAHKQSNRQRANGSICQAFRKAAAPSALPYSQTDHTPLPTARICPSTTLLVTILTY